MPRHIVVTKKISDNRVYYGLNIEENGYTNSYICLTDSKEKIEQLKRNLLNSDISAVHINDIIRDFITAEACDKLLINSLM